MHNPLLVKTIELGSVSLDETAKTKVPMLHQLYPLLFKKTVAAKHI